MEAGPFLVVKTGILGICNTTWHTAGSQECLWFYLTEVILLQGSWYFYINELKARTTVGIDTFKFSVMTNSFTGRVCNSGAPIRSIKMGTQLEVMTEPPSSVTTQSTTVSDPTNKIIFNSLAEPAETYSLFFIQPIHPSPLEST